MALWKLPWVFPSMETILWQWKGYWEHWLCIPKPRKETLDHLSCLQCPCSHNQEALRGEDVWEWQAVPQENISHARPLPPVCACAAARPLPPEVTRLVSELQTQTLPLHAPHSTPGQGGRENIYWRRKALNKSRRYLVCCGHHTIKELCQESIIENGTIPQNSAISW